jgi:hypothetical protein
VERWAPEQWAPIKAAKDELSGVSTEGFERSLRLQAGEPATASKKHTPPQTANAPGQTGSAYE